MGETYVDVDTGEQVNPQGQQSYIPSGNYRTNDKADLLEKIKPDLVVEIMRNKLLGMRWNEKRRIWEQIQLYKSSP